MVVEMVVMEVMGVMIVEMVVMERARPPLPTSGDSRCLTD
jgi:hypothetical protein